MKNLFSTNVPDLNPFTIDLGFGNVPGSDRSNFYILSLNFSKTYLPFLVIHQNGEPPIGQLDPGALFKSSVESVISLVIIFLYFRIVIWVEIEGGTGQMQVSTTLGHICTRFGVEHGYEMILLVNNLLIHAFLPLVRCY